MNIFLEIVLPIITSLLLGLVTGLLTHFKKQAKQYKELLQEQKEENWHKMIQGELEPLVKEVASLQAQINTLRNEEKEQIDIILGSYKFRLIYLCKAYLRQGYLTEDQLEQISEFYKTYHGLGGNGQAQEFYEKVLTLPVHD